MGAKAPNYMTEKQKAWCKAYPPTPPPPPPPKRQPQQVVIIKEKKIMVEQIKVSSYRQWWKDRTAVPCSLPGMPSREWKFIATESDLEIIRNHIKSFWVELIGNDKLQVGDWVTWWEDVNGYGSPRLTYILTYRELKKQMDELTVAMAKESK